ncbi:MAG: hypothetical protein ACYDEV_12865 [Acidiferrobacter sp.]
MRALDATTRAVGIKERGPRRAILAERSLAALMAERGPARQALFTGRRARLPQRVATMTFRVGRHTHR